MLDPVNLVKPAIASGNWLPPFKKLTEAQQQDVRKTIQELVPEDSVVQAQPYFALCKSHFLKYALEQN